MEGVRRRGLRAVRGNLPTHIFQSLADVEGNSGYSCQTDSTAWPWYTTDQCTYTNPGPVTYVYTTSIPGAGVVTSTVTKNEGFNAYGVQVRFQASDSISALTAATTATPVTVSSSSSDGGGASTTSASESTSAAATPNPQTTGLSTGDKAGLGVGVAIAAMLTIAAVLFFFLRRQRRRVKQQGELADRSELSARHDVAVKHELHNSPQVELHNNSVLRPVELE